MNLINTRQVSLTLPIHLCFAGSCRALSAPWVTSLESSEAHTAGAVVLSSNLGNFVAGLYVSHQGRWRFALKFTDVSNLLATDITAVTVIIDPTGAETYTATKVYVGGELQASTVIPVGGPSVYVAEDTSSGGSATVATISVGTVTSGAPGASATVVNSGSATAAVFNFVIPRGDAGPQGVQGVQGSTGSQGIQGDAGSQGSQGGPGPKGDTGSQGIQGDAGSQGIQGVQGIQGDAGSQGLTGDTGPKGDTGDAGPQGDLGPKGDTGDTGPQGVQGDPGPQGIQGTQGDAGPPGLAASVVLGTVTSGLVGGTPSVTNSGTSSNAILDFVIPKAELIVPAIISVATSGNINPTTAFFTEVCTASGVTRVLPTPSTFLQGYVTNVKNATSGPLEITGSVDSAAGAVISVFAGTSLQLQCDGVTWWRI